MSIVFFWIYAVITLISVIFLSLREFHMLQLNGYKTPEHSWWMKKNYKRYIFPAICFVLQYALCWTDFSIPAFLVFNICIAIANKPGKNFKKPFVYTARVKRMLTTFFILIAVIFACAYFFGRYRVTDIYYFSAEAFIIIGSALYLTPILVPLANLINKPIETAVQKWYINDAKKILASCPTLHKVGITGSYEACKMQKGLRY